MAQTLLETEIDQAYAKLKTQLTQSKCRITAEDPPKSVSAVQGSIWGITPKTAKKTITYTLWQDAAGTHVTSTSGLTSSYINLTLAGCVLSVALLVLCGWIAMDLQGYAANGAGFWGWLGQSGGQFDADKAAVFIRLTWILAGFLAGSLAVEAFIVSKVRSGIGVFTENIVRALQK